MLQIFYFECRKVHKPRVHLSPVLPFCILSFRKEFRYLFIAPIYVFLNNKKKGRTVTMIMMVIIIMIITTTVKTKCPKGSEPVICGKWLSRCKKS
jgi:hypothetical protein